VVVCPNAGFGLFSLSVYRLSNATTKFNVHQSKVKRPQKKIRVKLWNNRTTSRGFQRFVLPRLRAMSSVLPRPQSGLGPKSVILSFTRHTASVASERLMHHILPSPDPIILIRCGFADAETISQTTVRHCCRKRSPKCFRRVRFNELWLKDGWAKIRGERNFRCNLCQRSRVKIVRIEKRGNW